MIRVVLAHHQAAVYYPDGKYYQWDADGYLTVYGEPRGRVLGVHAPGSWQYALMDGTDEERTVR